ncbi:MAG: DUF5606 domain-containing protein [Flavobacteriales bacterium]|nr:DUF5606 domain-containing protein [Flavobacteriales bacterium]
MKTNLSKIISVGGKPGIYRVLNSSHATLIAESLTDGKRMPFHTTQKPSSLADISMFTRDEDVPLRSVLEKMKTHYNGQHAAEMDNPKALRDEVKKFFPDCDPNRVYDRDLKKLFSWYNILQAKDMLDFEDDERGKDKPEESSEEKKEPRL